MRIGVNFELNPFRQTGRCGQSGQPDGFVCVHCATRIRQEEVSLGIDVLKNVGETISTTTEIGAPERYRDDLGAAGSQGFAHDRGAGEFSGASQEPGRKMAVSDLEKGRRWSHDAEVNLAYSFLEPWAIGF